MRLAVHQVRPGEHHSGAGRGRQQNEAGDIAVRQIRWQPWPKVMRDEHQAKSAIKNVLISQLTPTVMAMPRQLADLAQSGQIDLQQHRHDHEPDQHRDRQIQLRHGCIADQMKDQQLAEGDTGMMQGATQKVRKRSNTLIAGLPADAWPAVALDSLMTAILCE